MPNEILPQAIAAIQAGDKERGRQLLIELVRSDVDNETAWLWLVHCVDKVEHKRKCFERVLEINPSNNYAQQGLHLVGLLDRLELPVDTVQDTTYTQVQPNDTGAATKHQLLQVRLERVSSELQRIFSEKVFDFPIGCWSLIYIALFAFAFMTSYEGPGSFWKTLGDTVLGCCFVGPLLLAVLLWAFNNVGSVLPD